MRDWTDLEPLLEIGFDSLVIHWRGPSPFFFAIVPDEHVGRVRDAAREASYGWGAVPVEVEIGDVSFTTSLFPRDGGYLLPLKDKVRRAVDVALGDMLYVVMRVRARKM